MAESDYTLLDDSLDISSIDRGVTAGVAPPNSAGSNNFVFGFNSKVTADGAAGLFTNQVNFAPMTKGGSIRGAIKRGLSGGNTGFAPMLFLGLQGTSVLDNGYILGIADGDPSHITLKKGSLATGLPDLNPDPDGANGILLQSVKTVDIDEWVHVRLDMIVNTNGDVILQCFENDLNVNPIGDPPSWTPIVGMEQIIDDALEVTTGSAAFTSGRAGFAFHSTDITRRGYFDHIEIFRQL